MARNAVRFGTFSIFLVAFILFVLAFSTPWWVYTGTGSTGRSFGLWMTCWKTFLNDKWECNERNLSQTDAETKATQAMMCLGLLANVVALLLFLVWLCKKDDKPVATGAGVASICGGVFNLIAVAVYAKHYNNSHIYSFDWSFILACVSTGLGILNGMITAVLQACIRN